MTERDRRPARPTETGTGPGEDRSGYGAGPQSEPLGDPEHDSPGPPAEEPDTDRSADA